MWLLLALPALAHAGHASLHLRARDRDLSVQLTVPSALLATADDDGDFRVTPAEAQAHSREVLERVREHVRFTTRGYPLEPELVSVSQPPESSSDRGPGKLGAAQTPVALGLRYRAPWKITDLRLRFSLFPEDETPECNVRAEGIGPSGFHKLVPGKSELALGKELPARRTMPAFFLLGVSAFFTELWPPLGLVGLLLATPRRYRLAAIGLFSVALGLLSPPLPPLSRAAYLLGALLAIAALSFLVPPRTRATRGSDVPETSART